MNRAVNKWLKQNSISQSISQSIDQSIHRSSNNPNRSNQSNRSRQWIRSSLRNLQDSKKDRWFKTDNSPKKEIEGIPKGNPWSSGELLEAGRLCNWFQAWLWSCGKCNPPYLQKNSSECGYKGFLSQYTFRFDYWNSQETPQRTIFPESNQIDGFIMQPWSRTSDRSSFKSSHC